MKRLDKEIRELTEKTEYTRYQFLQAELNTCVTALDMATYELSIGNLLIAKREADSVQKGIQTIERFLPETSGERRTQLEGQLASLKSAFQALLQELSGSIADEKSL